MENLVNLFLLSQIYSGKNVLVTGHTGFKGSWLVATLHLLGANVKGYALEPDENGLFTYLSRELILESTIDDIRNKEILRREIIDFQPDFIFHLAAQPLVRRSYLIPTETFEVNVIGTANLLEILKLLKKKCTIIIITTDKVYQNKETNILYKEDDILGGFDPYSASKACTEITVSSFRESFFNHQSFAIHQKAIATARAGNVIGGGDWSENRIIPDIIRSLKNNEKVLVRNPKAVRPWQHVLEPIGAYLVLGSKLDCDAKNFSTSYNIGPKPSDHLTVYQLVEKCIAAWGSGEWYSPKLQDQPHEAGLLQLSIEKIEKDLNWKPKLNASEAIRWTVEWYKQSPKSIVDFTFNQIKQYFTT